MVVTFPYLSIVDDGSKFNWGLHCVLLLVIYISAYVNVALYWVTALTNIYTYININMY